MTNFNLHILGSTTVLVASLLALSSCRDMDDQVVQQRNLVNLTPDIETKAVVATTSSLAEFTSFGYAQGLSNWDDVKSTATPNLMWNNAYTKSGSGWIGREATPWPDNEFKRYSFFAYSPQATLSNGITLLTTASVAGYQKLKYVTLSDARKQVDLVVAQRLNQIPVKEVPLAFKHTLTRVGFTAYANKPGISVKSIAINGVKYKGELEIRNDAVWSNVATDKANFEAEINSAELSTNVNTPTSLVGANGEYYFMLLPQDLSTNTDAGTCIAAVVVKDGKEKTVKYTITQNFEKGKAILYKLFITNEVDLVVSCGVTDWGQVDVATPIEGSYLDISSNNENTPAIFVYSTDYTGTVTVTEVGTTGKLTITHDPATKSFTVVAPLTGDYKVNVTAGKLSRQVKVTSNYLDYTSKPANCYVSYPAATGYYDIVFNALKRPRAYYAKDNATPLNPTNISGTNPAPALADALLGNDMTYLLGDFVDIQWQTAINNANTPGVNNMTIKSISLSADGLVQVKVNGPGNAVIAYKRAAVVLWTYHIWVTDSNPFTTFYSTGGSVNGNSASGAAKFMDRNLGALAATSSQPSTVDAYKYFGILYQHGRATPFTGQGVGADVTVSTSIYNINGIKINTGTIGDYILSATNVASVTAAIQTPNTIYINSDLSWYGFADISLWSTYGVNKSIYDPCPYGYRVPNDGSWNGFLFASWPAGVVSGGAVWNGAWWPAGGIRNQFNNGGLEYVGLNGWYWASTHALQSRAARGMVLAYNASASQIGEYSLSNGMSVRCVQEGY